ncbi:MAG: DUF885 family protein [Pseudomonadota bacterium]
METMDRRTILGGGASVFGLLVLPGCAQRIADDTVVTAAATGSSAGLDGVAYGLLTDYPEGATSLGLDKGLRAPLQHMLTDRSPAGVAGRANAAKARLSAVRELLPTLDGAPRLDAEVVVAAHELAVEGYAFGFGDTVNLDPVYGYRNGPYVVAQNMGAFVETPDFLVSTHRIETADDVEAYVDRVREYARQVAGETERLRADRASGIVAPDFILDKTLATLRGGLTQAPSETLLVTRLAEKMAKASLPPGAEDSVATLLNAEVKPALAAQVEELERHRAVATSTAGVGALANGEAYYDWALRAGTTTTLSPQEVHALGREKLREVQDRMDRILKANGLTTGTVGARMAALGERPDQIYPNTDAGRADLLAYLRRLTDDMRAKMSLMFNTLVPGFLEIVRVPPEIEIGAPGGSAAPGSIDGTQPGRYNINLRDTALQPKFGLPTLTYHEAIPGHVWQGEYTFKQPLVRTLLAFNAYSEGWALYAEQLADELGAYETDPFGELGYLQANAFRCCRLVVDTGMHALGWSRERAIQWFVENNGSPRGEVESEIDRYCVWPGQACGYKVGEIAINRARDRAQAALGDRYDIRAFNDAVVLGGAVPMTVLDGVIDRYIAEA